MAIRKKGKSPEKTKSAPASAVEQSVADHISLTTAKLTVSIKRRLANGDEVFIAPGIEMHCPEDELDAKQAEVTDRVNTWLTQLVEAYPDVDLGEDDDEDEVEDDDEDDDEDEVEDDEDDEDEGDDPTEAEVKKMKKGDLLALIEKYDLDIEPKGMNVADLKAAIIEELFEDEDEADEDDDEDDDEDEVEDEGEDDEDDEDEEEEDAYTKKELNALKLGDLQDIVDGWEIKHPKIKKGTSVAKKKAAYVDHILAAQEE